MPINTLIDTVAMTTMPSAVDFEPPQGVVEQMADGAYLASKRTYGAKIVMTWGVDAAPAPNQVNVVMAELRTKRNGLVEHVLAFTDPSGTPHTYNVLWPSEPSFRLIPGYLYGAITVEFFQRG